MLKKQVMEKLLVELKESMMYLELQKRIIKTMSQKQNRKLNYKLFFY